MTAPPTSPRRRNWFAFSLRTFLAAVTLFAVTCAAYTVYIRPYREEQQRWERFQTKWSQSAKSRNAPVVNAEFAGDEAVPKLLHNLGPKAFRFVRKLEFVDGDLTRDTAVDLASFVHLEAISVTRATVDSEFLHALIALPRLQSLSFSHVNFLDGTLVPLGDCRTLRELKLHHTRFKLADLKPLADSSVERIEIEGELTNAILSAGPPYQTLVPAEPLLLVNPDDAGLRGLAALNYWRDFPAGEKFSLHLKEGTLSAVGADALYALPISQLHLHSMKVSFAEQQRLFRDTARSWTCVADSASLTPAAFAETHGAEAATVSIGAARIAFPGVEQTWTYSLSREEWRDVFARLRNVETLRTDSTAPPEDFELWLTPPHLRALEIYTSQYRQLKLSSLKRVAGLEQLTVYHDASNPQLLEILGEMKHLAILRLWNASQGDPNPQMLRDIVAAPALKRLHLGNWLLCDEHWQELAAAERLEELHLHGDHPISAPAWRELSARLPRLTIRRNDNRLKTAGQ